MKTKKIEITVDQKIDSLTKKLKKTKNKVFIKKITCKKTKKIYEKLFNISEESLFFANEHYQKTKKLYKLLGVIEWFFSIIVQTVIVLTILAFTDLWSSAKLNSILSISYAIVLCEALPSKNFLIYYNWFVSQFNKINLTSPTILEFNFLKNFIKNTKTKSIEDLPRKNKQKIFQKKRTTWKRNYFFVSKTRLYFFFFRNN